MLQHAIEFQTKENTTSDNPITQAVEPVFDESEPLPCPRQRWARRSGGQEVSVYSLSDDGYAVLQIESGQGKGSAILREFWILHRDYTCVQDVRKAQA